MGKKPTRYRPSSVFRFLTGDVNFADYGGKWWRCVSQGRFHVVELTNMNEACGKDNEGRPTYVVELSEIDLDAIPRKLVEDALRSCGWKVEAASPAHLFPATVTEDWGEHRVVANGRATELCIVETIHGYGARAPLGSWEGNAWRPLMAQARAESRSLDDPDAYEAAMAKPVNKLGSTAREFAQGDFNSALVRGVTAGDRSAKLMAKIQGASPEAIEAVEKAGPPPQGFAAQVAIGKVPSDDPLAYTMGFMAAMGGSALDRPGTDRKELAPAYLEGYRLGVAVKSGSEPTPDWVR